MSKEFKTFLDKIIQVIEKKKSELKYHSILPYDPSVLLQLPLIAVEWDGCEPLRINERYARYTLHANIYYHYAKFDGGTQKLDILERLSYLTTWLLQNQTMLGYSIDCWVDQAAPIEVSKDNVIIASGLLKFRARVDNIDINWIP